jgi:amino acid transporter
MSQSTGVTSKRKAFGFWSIVLLGINGVVGSGIFLLPGQAFTLAGPGSIYIYLLVALIVASIALCFAECAGKFERHGASYQYARAALGEFVGFEVGIMSWAIRVIAWATMSVGFVTALSAIWPGVSSEPYNSIAIVLVILIGLGVVNILGVNLARLLNNVATVGKLLPLVLFVAIGIFYIKGPNFTPVFPKNFDSNVLGAAILLIFYAFTGFEAMAVAAADMDNPRKNLPWAILLVIALSSVIYFLVQAVSVGTLGSALAGSKAPIADAASHFLGVWGKWLVTIGALISIGGINIAASFEVPRGVVALASDGLLPRKLAEHSRRYGTPHWAILATVAFAIPVALSGSFVQLAAISVVSRFAQYIPTALAVLILRKKRPDLAGTFTIPFGPVIPVFSIAVSVWLLTKADPTKLSWGLGALAIGVPLYFILKYANTTRSEKALN